MATLINKEHRCESNPISRLWWTQRHGDKEFNCLNCVPWPTTAVTSALERVCRSDLVGLHACLRVPWTNQRLPVVFWSRLSTGLQRDSESDSVAFRLEINVSLLLHIDNQKFLPMVIDISGSFSQRWRTKALKLHILLILAAHLHRGEGPRL